MDFLNLLVRALNLLITGFLIGVVLGLLSAFVIRGSARAEDVSKQYSFETTFSTVNKAAEFHGIDPLLVLSIITVESRWNPKAIGTSGEAGLMQLHPRYHHASFDVTENINEGVAHLAWVKKYCPHRADNTFVVCYNQGVNRTPKFPKKHPYYRNVMAVYETLKEKASKAD